MSKQIYTVLNILYLVIMAILIALGAVKSWFNLAMGVVMGMAIYELAITYRNRNSSGRRLK